MRSIKSEYDYGSKKKFLDVMGNISIDAKLNRMRAQHEMEKSSGRARGYSTSRTGDASYKTYSKTTGRSRYSKRSSTCTHKHKLVVMNSTEPIDNPISELVDEESEFEVAPEDFDNICKSTNYELTEDEKIINARFANEALAEGRDISVFPVSIASIIDKLESYNKEATQRQDRQHKPKEGKGVFFPSNKKFYETSMFQNSEDFKQLGTLHIENRASEYYPLEAP